MTIRLCPILLRNVRFQKDSPSDGSRFDPSPTLAVHCGDGFDAGLSPIKVLFGADTMLAPELRYGYAAT
jgi:hypothetical protein